MAGFFTDVMTVYNHGLDPLTGQDTWTGNTIPGVQWTHGKRQINVVNGIATENTVESVTIDFQGTYRDRKPYLEPPEYRRLPPEEKGEYWTLDQQDGMDYLVLGESRFEIRKPSELRERFLYQGKVVAVTDNRSRPRLRHIRVTVK